MIRDFIFAGLILVGGYYALYELPEISETLRETAMTQIWGE